MKKTNQWNQLPLVLGVEDLAIILSVKGTTIRRWARQRKLPARKIGKQYFFDRDQIERLVKEGEQ